LGAFSSSLLISILTDAADDVLHSPKSLSTISTLGETVVDELVSLNSCRFEEGSPPSSTIFFFRGDIEGVRSGVDEEPGGVTQVHGI
jgi:hypothetical protein